MQQLLLVNFNVLNSFLLLDETLGRCIITILTLMFSVSENYQKFRFITKSVLATFSGDVKSFEDMCEVLSSKVRVLCVSLYILSISTSYRFLTSSVVYCLIQVEEYKKMSIESTADMVSRWAFDLMESTNYSMLIIGAENEVTK